MLYRIKLNDTWKVHTVCNIIKEIDSEYQYKEPNDHVSYVYVNTKKKILDFSFLPDMDSKLVTMGELTKVLVKSQNEPLQDMTGKLVSNGSCYGIISNGYYLSTVIGDFGTKKTIFIKIENNNAYGFVTEKEEWKRIDRAAFRKFVTIEKEIDSY